MKMKLMRGEIDILQGSIWKGLLRFSLPVAATAILSQLFNAADIAVVGNFAGDGSTVAVAAVGANSPIISLILNLFIGIALGVTVVIANSISTGDKKMVKNAVHTSIIVAIVGGVIVGILGELFAVPLLEMLSVPLDVLPYASLYLKIYFIGMPVILLYNFESAIFRSVGETRIPLIALASSGVLNIFLNLFFVAILHMTVDGVAIATVASNAVSSIILYRALRNTNKEIHLELNDLKFNMLAFKRIIKIGLPSGIQSSVFAISNIVIQAAINSLGTIVMAASSAALNIETISYNAVNAFSQGCTTFVGQNYGANNVERCKKTLIISMIEGFIVIGMIILMILTFGKPLLAIFDNDPEVITLGYTRLVFIMITHVFILIYEVLSGYLRGFGISFAPAVLTMLGVCGIRIGWIQMVFPLSKTFKTIMIGYPVSLVITTILVLIAVIHYRPYHRFIKGESSKH